jgi:hypothetical protein
MNGVTLIYLFYIVSQEDLIVPKYNSNELIDQEVTLGEVWHLEQMEK